MDDWPPALRRFELVMPHNGHEELRFKFSAGKGMEHREEEEDERRRDKREVVKSVEAGPEPIIRIFINVIKNGSH